MDIEKTDRAVRIRLLLQNAELYVAISRYFIEKYLMNTSIHFGKEDFFQGLDETISILHEVKELADFYKD